MAYWIDRRVREKLGSYFSIPVKGNWENGRKNEKDKLEEEGIKKKRGKEGGKVKEEREGKKRRREKGMEGRWGGDEERW